MKGNTDLVKVVKLILVGRQDVPFVVSDHILLLYLRHMLLVIPIYDFGVGSCTIHLSTYLCILSHVNVNSR